MGISFDPRKPNNYALNTNDANTSGRAKNGEEDKQLKENDDEVKRLAAEEGKYVKASVENIVKMGHLKMDRENSIFVPEHIRLAQLTNASEFSSAKTPQEQRQAINNLKNKTQNAISQFKDLIRREDDAIKKHDEKNNNRQFAANNSNNPMSRNGSIFGSHRPPGSTLS